MNKESPEKKFIHDLGTPLSTALLLMEVLLESSPEQEKMSKVMDSLNKLRVLVEQRRSELLEETKP